MRENNSTVGDGGNVDYSTVTDDGRGGLRAKAVRNCETRIGHTDLGGISLFVLGKPRITSRVKLLYHSIA